MQEPLQKPAFSKQALLHCAGIVGAGLLYSLGINLFVVPTGLYTGGIMGFAQLLRTLFLHLTGLELKIDIAGIINYAINLPILCIAWRRIDHRVVFKTLLSVTSTTVFLSLIPRTGILHGDQLAECLIGGILCGFALGLALTCGCSTGGLDVVGLCLAKRGSRFTVGRFSLGFNIMLYVACAFLFDLRTAIYSVIYTVFCALFIDRGHQQNINVQVLIFTKDTDPALPQRIMSRIGRGLTYWEGKGAYTGSDIRVLCVCVSKFETADLQETVHEIDPHAFFIVQEGVRIGGNFIRKIS